MTINKVLSLCTVPLLALSASVLVVSCGDEPSGGGHAEHGGHEEAGGHEEGGHEEGGHEEGGHEEEEGGADITLTDKQAELGGIKTAVVANGQISVELFLPGEVSLNQDRVAHIVPRVSGITKKVHSTLGSQVRAGEVMVELESSELGEAKADFLEKSQRLLLAQTDLERVHTIHDNTLTILTFLKSGPTLDGLSKMRHLDLGENRSALISTYAETVFARATYLREKGLFEEKISSGNEYLESKNVYKKAEAEFASARDQITFAIKRSLLEKTRAQKVAKFSLGVSERHLHLLGLSDADVRSLGDGKETHATLTRYDVQAPFDGTVIEKHITQGERVDESMALYTLSNLSTLWVMCSAYEKDIAQVKIGQDATFTVRAYSNRTFKGQVTWIADTIDEETRTLKFRLLVDNTDHQLKPGMFAHIKLNVSTKSSTMLVPAAAIQMQKGEAIVFVVENGGKYARREVTLGTRADAQQEIVSGLRIGEKVVTSGSFILKSEAEKAGFHAHNH